VAGDGGPPFAIAGARVGVLICFEDVFADEALARARDAELLAVITNDGFFARSGVEQHLQITVLRAVETGRSIARAGNTGVSALIDPRGRVVRRAPPGPQVAVGALARSTARTPYSRAPDAVPMAALAAALAALAVELVRRARGGEPRP
jgi:apolipoprotein N-acyltransferase